MPSTLFINPLPYPLYVLAKPVGALCNMDCEYCYYTEKSLLYPHRKSLKMPEELLERYIASYIQSQTTPSIQFTWHGGEALLRGIDYYRKAIKFQKLFGQGREISNCMQTNGLLLNDEWCRFFKENRFLVGISIDGPENMHNHYRKDCGGRDTFKRVMHGIDLLHKYAIDFNTLSVLYDFNVKYPLEMYRFLKGIGSRYMQFSPVVERTGTREDGLELLTVTDSPEDSEISSWSVDPVDYGQFYIDIFKEWVKQDVGTYYVQLFDATLACMVGQQPGVCIFGKTCGHALAMEHNGDVYACDHFVYPEYCRGNIYNRSFIEMALSEEQIRFGNNKHLLLPTQCRRCRFLSLCNGECPKNRILRTHDGEVGLNYLCAGLQRYFTYVMPYMEYMAEQLRNQRPPAHIMQSDLVRKLH